MIHFDLKKIDAYYIVTVKTDITEIGTFHRMAAIIYSLGWDVISGDLNTVIESGIPYSLDTLKLRPTQSNNSKEIMEIGILMDSIFSKKIDYDDLVRKYKITPPSANTFFSSRAELIFANDFEKNTTCFYMEADSREGLLYHVTKVFLGFRINIISATIETDMESQRAKDTFFLVDEEGSMFGEKPIANQIRDKILGIL